MPLKNLYFLFILFSSFIGAQKPVTIDEINKQFDEVNVYVNTGNPDKAFPILNKIKKECKDIDYKKGLTRLGHTLAIIYFNSSDYKKVITLDDDYLKIGLEINDYDKLSHIHRLKGAAYAELGLLNKGSEERFKALQYARKMEAGNSKYYAMSLIYSNLADQYIKSNAAQDSIFSNIKKSIEQAEKLSEDKVSDLSRKYSLIAYSSMILANEYSKFNDQKLAENYYLKALEIHNTKPVLLVERVVLLSQLGSFYYEETNYKEAVKYGELGIDLEKKASFPVVRRDLLETLSKSYLELHQTDRSKKNLTLFMALNDSIKNSDRNAVDVALNSTVSKQEKKYLDNTSRSNLIYLICSVTVALLALAFFFYYRRRKQIQIKKIENILEKLKLNQLHAEDYQLTSNEVAKPVEKELEKNLMPAEAEKGLLEKLQYFEDKKLYLERKVSLSFVATEIESNTKYLSYIIKKHRGKDFTKYINDLRINYIVQKINDDPKYRQYKINFLAEETGFSSHSKFAIAFKNTIGVSPSEFIHYFEKYNKMDSAQE